MLEPDAGLHANVWVFDFKSLYPSLIRTFNIDPVGYVPGEAPGGDLIDTPGGNFRRGPAILPRILDELFPRREAAKKRHDEVASHAIKILMNSFYGVLGTPACRFFNPALANSITGMGKHMLLWSKSWFESAGFKVIYGDTDSLFVSSPCGDPIDARRRARDLAASLNGDLARYIATRWRRESRLELEFEKLYSRLFLPRATAQHPRRQQALCRLGDRRRCRRSRVRGHGGGAAGLDRAGKAGAARALPAAVHRSTRGCLSGRHRGPGAQRRPR